MGWTTMHRYEPVKELFTKQIEWGNRYKVIDCKIVHMTELYAAILDTQTNQVRGEVWLLRYYKSGSYYKNMFGNVQYNFGYKAMNESCGPYYFKCPKSVLDKLTPTEDNNANEWRKQCLELINNRKK